MKKIPDVTMEIYVMQPTKAQWESNIKKRELSDSVQRIMGDAEVIEFPNPAEGFDAIYEVVDGQIKLRMEESRPEILEPARKEIQEETEEILTEEKLQKERKQLMESMETRKFWHYCEGCGKKEFLTADEAHEAGWDYPPRMGHFGLLSPRTCGNCVITSTLYWKVATGGGLPIVFEEELTPEEKVTWNRIKNEPESLLEEE